MIVPSMYKATMPQSSVVKLVICPPFQRCPRPAVQFHEKLLNGRSIDEKMGVGRKRGQRCLPHVEGADTKRLTSRHRCWYRPDQQYNRHDASQPHAEECPVLTGGGNHQALEQLVEIFGSRMVPRQQARLDKDFETGYGV